MVYQERQLETLEIKNNLTKDSPFNLYIKCILAVSKKEIVSYLYLDIMSFIILYLCGCDIINFKYFNSPFFTL